MSERHLRQALAAKKYYNDVLSVSEIIGLLDRLDPRDCAGVPDLMKIASFSSDQEAIDAGFTERLGNSRYAKLRRRSRSQNEIDEINRKAAGYTDS